ncbi:MAG: FtsQ-type POTRA domain-containing protein [Candidatus Eisenbacteria bacterium]|nr:FtsQ-type POTRA domain-containing protein [Candidatus Eisenbacteria bacterium]MCC7144095.1 FtsQ-type POTRA domain-containing protein [Candidatus Eisenbacteria bacterium]
MREEFHSILPPRRKKRSAGPILAVLLGLGAVVGGARLLPALGVPRFWTVREIEVKGNRALATEDLLARLELSAGMPWWAVSPDRIAERARKVPRLQSAEVEVNFPRGLSIAVEERDGIMRVIDGTGAPSLEMSVDGVLLEVVPGLSAVDLPWLSGSLPQPLSAGAHIELQNGQQWEAQLARLRSDWPRLWQSLSEVRYVGDLGFEMYLRDGRMVLLWDPTVNDDLWAQVPRVLQDLESWQVDDAVLNLRFRDQLVVKPASDQMPEFEVPVEDEVEGEDRVPDPAGHAAHRTAGTRPTNGRRGA